MKTILITYLTDGSLNVLDKHHLLCCTFLALILSTVNIIYIVDEV